MSGYYGERTSDLSEYGHLIDTKENMDIIILNKIIENDVKFSKVKTLKDSWSTNSMKMIDQNVGILKTIIGRWAICLGVENVEVVDNVTMSKRMECIYEKRGGYITLEKLLECVDKGFVTLKEAPNDLINRYTDEILKHTREYYEIELTKDKQNFYLETGYGGVHVNLSKNVANLVFGELEIEATSLSNVADVVKKNIIKLIIDNNVVKLSNGFVMNNQYYENYEDLSRDLFKLDEIIFNNIDLDNE